MRIEQSYTKIYAENNTDDSIKNLFQKLNSSNTNKSCSIYTHD